jgi:hypothetical protein
MVSKAAPIDLVASIFLFNYKRDTSTSLMDVKTLSCNQRISLGIGGFSPPLLVIRPCNLRRSTMQPSQPQTHTKAAGNSSDSGYHAKAAESCGNAASACHSAAKASDAGDKTKAAEHGKIAHDHLADAQDHLKKANVA